MGDEGKKSAGRAHHWPCARDWPLAHGDGASSQIGLVQIDPRVRKRHGLDGSDGRQACVRCPGQQPVPECKQVSKGHEDKKKGNKNPDLTLNRVYARRAVLDETIERLEREKARLTPPTPRTSEASRSTTAAATVAAEVQALRAELDGR